MQALPAGLLPAVTTENISRAIKYFILIQHFLRLASIDAKRRVIP
jgi:hypothetical protein